VVVFGSLTMVRSPNPPPKKSVKVL